MNNLYSITIEHRIDNIFHLNIVFCSKPGSRMVGVPTKLLRRLGVIPIQSVTTSSVEPDLCSKEMFLSIKLG